MSKIISRLRSQSTRPAVIIPDEVLAESARILSERQYLLEA